jgi:hypothetical protein
MMMWLLALFATLTLAQPQETEVDLRAHAAAAGQATRKRRGRSRTPAEWAAQASSDDYWTSVENEWEAGDDVADVLSEDQQEYQRIEARKNAPVDPSDFDMSDPSAWISTSQASAGPTMMFAKLRTPTLKAIAEGNVGGVWAKEDTQMKASMWKELLFTGGVEVTCYDIEWDTVLVTLQRGWNGLQLKEFLLKQPETWQVTWDQHKFSPPGLDPPPEVKVMKTKKKKKKKKKKKRKIENRKRMMKKKNSQKRKQRRKKGGGGGGRG